MRVKKPSQGILNLIIAIVFISPILVAKEKKINTSHAHQNIIIKLGSYTNDLHSVTMALKFSEMLAKKKAKVTLFLNLEAVRLADKRQPQDLQWGHSPKISNLYKKAIDAGVAILVCPHCAKVIGLEQINLRKPAQMGNSKSLPNMILEADKIIDY